MINYDWARLKIHIRPIKSGSGGMYTEGVLLEDGKEIFHCGCYHCWPASAIECVEGHLRSAIFRALNKVEYEETPEAKKCKSR